MLVSPLEVAKLLPVRTLFRDVLVDLLYATFLRFSGDKLIETTQDQLLSFQLRLLLN